LILHIANLCNFTRVIAYTVLVQSLLFGGKDKTGDGTPEGLPLICRFSDAFGVLGLISR
jgi:hypothetical protein